MMVVLRRGKYSEAGSDQYGTLWWLAAKVRFVALNLPETQGNKTVVFLL